MRERVILCIDLKSFYASVECTIRGLDPLTTPLVVADEGRGGGSIVLAVSPYLRALGMPSRLRIFEIDPKYKIIFAKPRMNTYIDYSIKVIDTYLDFISDEDLFIYSIDEAFLDVTEYLSYYQMSAYELAQTILKALFDRLGLYATCGIGPNMLIAKLALDLESKTKKDYIAEWQLEDIKTKLWPIKPLSKMWGIGPRMEHNLNRLGIYTIHDLAHYDPNKLKKLFGIMGLELYHHAHGRDDSLIQKQESLKIVNQSYSIGQVLFKDYTYETAKLIIREMCEDITRRLRLNKKMCWTVSLSIGYSKAIGGGFSRQMRLDNKTNNESRLLKAFMMLYETYIEDFPIRQIHLSVTNLSTIDNYQLSLFEDYQAEQLQYELDLSVDLIKQKYGKNAIDKATTLYEHSTKRHRNTAVGGHNG
ncbi:MAG: Y-family DNA polymerase [Acholeplasmataceae bacterium]